MIKGLKDIFNEVKATLGENLSSAQEDGAFASACNLFFGEVLIREIKDNEYITNAFVKIGSVVDIDGKGRAKVISISPFYEDKVNIFLRPENYSSYKISNTYAGDFCVVCEHYIKNAFIQNNNVLNGLGIETGQTENVALSEIREMLRNKYNHLLPVIV